MIKIGSDEEEYHLFCKLYRAVFDEMEFPLSDAQIEQMAFIQTYRDDRYLLFDDVLPYLSRWRGKYKLGIVSDAPPSTRRILTQMGVMQYIDAATFSCDLGVLKPDPAIYRATLDRLQVLPGEALFVDDFPSKLRGAKALGMHCVQMRRPMPELFQTAPEWEGDMAHDFQEIDEYVNALR
jgi:putative hydrolase of the HAD superfamily